MLVHLFFSPRNRDGHLAGLIEAKPEVLSKNLLKLKRCAILRSTILYLCKFSVGAIVKAL